MSIKNKLSGPILNVHVFAPNFMGGAPSKFWDLDYKIEEISDHVAKFHSDQARELKDFALKKKTKHQE